MAQVGKGSPARQARPGCDRGLRTAGDLLPRLTQLRAEAPNLQRFLGASVLAGIRTRLRAGGARAVTRDARSRMQRRTRPSCLEDRVRTDQCAQPASPSIHGRIADGDDQVPVLLHPVQPLRGNVRQRKAVPVRGPHSAGVDPVPRVGPPTRRQWGWPAAKAPLRDGNEPCSPCRQTPPGWRPEDRPTGDVRVGGRAQRQVPASPVALGAATHDQVGLFEHLEVVGEQVRRHAQGGADLGSGHVPDGEQVHDLQARHIGRGPRGPSRATPDSAVRSMFIASSLTETFCRVKMVVPEHYPTAAAPGGCSPSSSAPPCWSPSWSGPGIAAQQLSPDDVGLQLLENAPRPCSG